jgi:hypothetical protein
MSRQSDQLEMLHNKLSRRYGAGDTLCTQVSAALESCRKHEPAGGKKHDWSVTYKHTIAAHRQATLKANHH